MRIQGLTQGVTIIRSAFGFWNEDKVPRLAAAIAFAAIFSIAPLLIITIAIVGGVLGFSHSAHPHTIVENGLIDRVRAGAGAQAAVVVRQMVDASFAKSRNGLLAQVIGWVTFVIAATGVIAALQDALNTIWHVEPKKRSVVALIRDRAMTAALLFIGGLVLLASTIASAALSYVSGHAATLFPFAHAAIVLTVADWLLSTAATTLLFALIYKFLPDAVVDFGDVWLGAAASAILFVIGQALIAWYLGYQASGSAYGFAGALLALLLWMYYSSMLLLFGAEVTRALAQSRSMTIHAVPARRNEIRASESRVS